ncbi:ABC transporter transmembrane domain-containing protein [Spartinivicinus poritis]|uniref:ABC transporter transmembrane domain-containing protein n=1 Tax=Spartinivicinus poritis TaxID=2994640 RepID=A0ABT5UB62_9GAMM|nr:ABC transporter transmembrane domain-containing protein [Spartinivicinus sp. A2-2]MDE1463425.1 ABC transporter transmembrane domain-containing protein [Spartinivicinus sp. A2-2]
MESSIYRFILKYTLKDQVLILFLTVFSFPLVYATLEVPKHIINDALNKENVPETVWGYPVDQIDYLLVLCFIFLGLVIINGVLKYLLNVYRGVVGERMLKKLRFDLYSRILRFPVPHFKKVSQGEIIPIITAETEPLGGFIGEAFALPAFQGGLLLTYLFFIYNQDVILGIAATALYPLQLYIIPKLQRIVNQLGKQRVLAARRLGDKIGDSIGGIKEIHSFGTFQFERSKISDRLQHIFEIRYKIYKLKFFIKFLNNFLGKVTPFFFYSVGGYYVIKGELSLGALIAALAAYQDLDAPWKELLKYYQTKEDIRIKYEQIVYQFHPENMLASHIQDGPATPLTLQNQHLTMEHLYYGEHENVNTIDDLNLTLPLNQHTAIVGNDSSGKNELVLLLTRLLIPRNGRINLAAENLQTLTSATLSQHICYLDNSPHFFSGTIRQNLLYGLNTQPPTTINEVPSLQIEDPIFVDNWFQPSQLGFDSDQAVDHHLISILSKLKLEDDIYHYGLQGYLNPATDQTLMAQVIELRRAFREAVQTSDMTDIVEFFDWGKYNNNLTVAENILFGSSREMMLDLNMLHKNTLIHQLLDDEGLMDTTLAMGYEVAGMMLELFADVEPGSDLFERFSFIQAEEINDYKALLAKANKEQLYKLPRQQIEMLLSLVFQLTPARHRLGLLSNEVCNKLLNVRKQLAKALKARHTTIIFYDSEEYNEALSIQENILFGKAVYGQARAQAKITACIDKLIASHDLIRPIMGYGLDYEVGTAGTRLSLAMRQKLALARALLKKPDLLIINQATSVLDLSTESEIISQVKQAMINKGLIWVLNRAEQAIQFDQTLVVDKGQIIQQGHYQQLIEMDKTLAGLIQ